MQPQIAREGLCLRPYLRAGTCFAGSNNGAALGCRSGLDAFRTRPRKKPRWSGVTLWVMVPIEFSVVLTENDLLVCMMQCGTIGG